MKLCLPAAINLFFVVLFVLNNFRYGIVDPVLFVINVAISLAITYFINRLCLTGHPYLAWGLLFLPLILTLILVTLLLVAGSLESFTANYKCADYHFIYCTLEKGCGCNKGV